MWAILGFLVFIAYWAAAGFARVIYENSCRAKGKNPAKGKKIIENCFMAGFVVLIIFVVYITSKYSY